MLHRYIKIDWMQIKRSKAEWWLDQFWITRSGWRRIQRSGWTASKPKPHVLPLELDLWPHDLLTLWDMNLESLTLWDAIVEKPVTMLYQPPGHMFHSSREISACSQNIKTERDPQAMKLHPVIFTAERQTLWVWKHQTSTLWGWTTNHKTTSGLVRLVETRTFVFWDIMGFCLLLKESILQSRQPHLPYETKLPIAIKDIEPYFVKPPNLKGLSHQLGKQHPFKSIHRCSILKFNVSTWVKMYWK